MQLGLIGYYSDFVVYQLVIGVLGVAGLIEVGEEGAPDWIGTALIC
ncbi:sterol desaturase family protein, partial [Mesorhizobium sp. M00.F.Ca.ET.158.01.1.1]